MRKKEKDNKIKLRKEEKNTIRDKEKKEKEKFIKGNYRDDGRRDEKREQVG